MVINHPVKSDGHWNCDNGNIIVSVCHVILKKRVAKGSCDFMDGNPLK